VEHRLAVRHDRLDLDDEDRAGRAVATEHIDRSTLAADRERDLDENVPVEIGEERGNPLDQASMRRVEQPIEVLATPAQARVQACLERRRVRSAR
jgi:hypothetical protein